MILAHQRVSSQLKTEKGKFLESEKGEGKLFQRYESYESVLRAAHRKFPYQL